MHAVSPYSGTVGSGSSQEPEWTSHPEPVPAPLEVLVEVQAAALNRGDLLQMRGLYPPPRGASEVPGLEAAGIVRAVGSAVTDRAVGDEVVALLAGGGQAEMVCVAAGQTFPKPPHLSWARAGGLAEVAITSWTNLVYEGSLCSGQTVLITAAASGVGSYCVQVASELGAIVLVAGRKLERLERLRVLGASGAFALGDDLPVRVRATVPGGVDLVIDLVGGTGIAAALGCLRDGGRLVLVGLLGGTEASLPLGDILRRRLELRGSVLRSRSAGEKTGLVRSFTSWADPLWSSGKLDPLVDRVLPFERVADAYRMLATEEVLGKIVLARDRWL